MLLLVVTTTAFSPQLVFSSPSGKLTYAPELVIPDPKDPTAILLLSNAVQTLSERIRSAGSNSAFVDGSIAALRTFCNEQAQAEGNFPGPVAVIYCGKEADYAEIQNAGAQAVLVEGEIDCWTGNSGDDAFRQKCQDVTSAGLEPIPEILLGEAEVNMDTLLESIEKSMGQKPRALVLSPPAVAFGDEDEDDDNAEVIEPPTLPTISRELTKEVPVLGSIRTVAGEGRLSLECNRFKDAGFNGVLLRSDCVPGFRLQPDLEIVSSFWQAVIADLKSTRSKSFGFRSKNNMDVSAATKWGNYQQNIMDSGALGDPDDNVSMMDAANGDYKGF